MDCERVEHDQLVEKYLTGRLGPQEQEAFEEHYFSCSRCFEELQAYRALQAELRESEAAIKAEPAARRVVGRWAWAAAAAVVVVVVGFTLWVRSPEPSVEPSPQVAAVPAAEEPATPPEAQARTPEAARAQAPTLSELARVEPPLYIAARLRGPVDESAERFRAGMEHYEAGQYTAAIPELRAAREVNPKAPNITFFLAICYLLTGETDAAISGLQETTALGDSPYLEEAHFYLAKAFLHNRDVKGARGELERAVELHGRLESDAREILRQLDKLSKVPR